MNTMNYYKDRVGAVGFVEDLLQSLKPGYVLTTTIRREKSGDYSVISATEELSDDTEMPDSLKQPTNT